MLLKDLFIPFSTGLGFIGTRFYFVSTAFCRFGNSWVSSICI